MVVKCYEKVCVWGVPEKYVVMKQKQAVFLKSIAENFENFDWTTR